MALYRGSLNARAYARQIKQEVYEGIEMDSYGNIWAIRGNRRVRQLRRGKGMPSESTDYRMPTKLMEAIKSHEQNTEQSVSQSNEQSNREGSDASDA